LAADRVKVRLGPAASGQPRDELGRLAETFNALLSRLEASAQLINSDQLPHTVDNFAHP